MADDMKFAPAELVGKRDHVARDLTDRVGAWLVTRIAVTADVEKRITVPVVECLEHRREHAMVPKPAVDENDLNGPVADRLVPDHSGLLIVQACGADDRGPLFRIGRYKTAKIGWSTAGRIYALSF